MARTTPAKSPTSPAVVLDPENAAKEKASFAAWKARHDELLILPRIKLEEDGCLGNDFPDGRTGHLLLMSALGLSRSAEMTAVLSDLASVTATDDGKVNLSGLNSALAMVASMKPQNTVETMLATQMVAVHVSTMNAAARLNRATAVDRIDANAGTMNRLARTFTMQIEALKKLRPGAAQHVVVEHRHYHLHQGAEPPAGDPGAGVTTEIEDQSHERMRIPERAAVLGALEAERLPLPGAGHEGKERVSVPRGKGRSANGAG